VNAAATYWLAILHLLLTRESKAPGQTARVERQGESTAAGRCHRCPFDHQRRETCPGDFADLLDRERPPAVHDAPPKVVATIFFLTIGSLAVYVAIAALIVAVAT
jgi:hypothetical protein